MVAQMMVDCDCGSIPVVGEDGKPIGIITDRDIVTRTIAREVDPMFATAREAMTMPPITVEETTRLSEVVELLELSQIRRAIVVDRTGVVTGVVAQADIARYGSKWRAGDLLREVSRPGVATFAR
jgi:CBS domain-containing protein